MLWLAEEVHIVLKDEPVNTACESLTQGYWTPLGRFQLPLQQWLDAEEAAKGIWKQATVLRRKVISRIRGIYFD